MTKFSAAVIPLLCLFIFSTAQTSPENDDSTTPNSEFSPALRLPGVPSNKETETTTTVETAVSAPLTKTAFHTINRRFAARLKKRCRQHVKVLPTIRENEMIPHRNDKIVASAENPVIHEEEPLIPRGWLGMHHHRHHHEDSDSDSDDDVDENDRTEEKENKKTTKFVFNEYGKEVLEKMKQNEKKKRKGCFFRRLRKFLDSYL